LLIVISRLFVVIKLACRKVIWLSGAYCSLIILLYLIVFNYLCWIFFLVIVCSRVCLTSGRLNNKMYFLIEYCHEAELAKKCWKRKKNKKMWMNCDNFASPYPTKAFHKLKQKEVFAAVKMQQFFFSFIQTFIFIFSLFGI
jgi:hypothetical protein